MIDEALRQLAQAAGIATEWRDQKGATHEVEPETLRSLLGILGLDCRTAEAQRRSRARLEERAASAEASLLTVRVGEPRLLPGAAKSSTRARLRLEDGSEEPLTLETAPTGSLVLPPLTVPGYHRLELDSREVTIAAAPERCFSIEDAAGGERIFGLAAQTYALRRHGDGGTGDLAAVASLATGAAAEGADAILLSPLHALFPADPSRFSPYSPSSRLFYNPLYAAPAMVLGEERVARAMAGSGLDDAFMRLEALELIDWPQAAAAKMTLLRSLFADFEKTELAALPSSTLAADYQRFRSEGGDLLTQHARFEALQQARLDEDLAAWSWRSWPVQWRDPASPDVASFAESHAREISFFIFLQWLCDRAHAKTQSLSRAAGMRIGLISDLAIGMDGTGSHAWSRQEEVLVGASIGAPPDNYNANGQNWGLTSFSPHALSASGFAPFIATLRAALRHCGGVRVDHIMGFMRLWLIPEGAAATEGAYLSYPLEDLLRLTALESFRQRAIVIGEDLGTVPEGFRERLAREAVAGIQVLRFERDQYRFFRAPATWRSGSIAMTTIHDLAPTAGWWAGHDIAVRQALFGQEDAGAFAEERGQRTEDRHFLWGALRHAEVAGGDEPAEEATEPVVDATVRYAASTPCTLALLPLEDMLGLREQPNLPGTTDEHPNWRRRLPGDAPDLLRGESAARRVAVMRARRSGKR